MSTKNYPTITYLKKCLRYEDGKIYWLKRPKSHFIDERAWKIWNTRYSNKEAGSFTRDKKSNICRYRVAINTVSFFRHTIIYALIKKIFILELDHKDGNSLNDKIDNLRPATRSQNRANSRRYDHNTSGYKGVSWDTKTNKWRARIKINRKEICIGYFNNKLDAHIAYCKSADEYFKEFARYS